MQRMVTSDTGDGDILSPVFKLEAEPEYYTDVPWLQQLGLSSRPKQAGNPAIMGYIQGEIDDPIILAIASDENLDVLEPGETIVYSELGHKILLKENDDVEITFPNSGKLVVNGDVKDMVGTLDQVRKDLASLETKYNLHIHNVTDLPSTLPFPQPPAEV